MDIKLMDIFGVQGCKNAKVPTMLSLTFQAL